MKRLALLLPLVAALVVGCGAKTEVSHSDAEKNREAFSQEAYEEAMRKAGREDELAQEKANAAARSGEQQQSDQG
jgi:hypothetical protein